MAKPGIIPRQLLAAPADCAGWAARGHTCAPRPWKPHTPPATAAHPWKRPRPVPACRAREGNDARDGDEDPAPSA